MAATEVDPCPAAARSRVPRISRALIKTAGPYEGGVPFFSGPRVDREIVEGLPPGADRRDGNCRAHAAIGPYAGQCPLREADGRLLAITGPGQSGHWALLTVWWPFVVAGQMSAGLGLVVIRAMRRWTSS
jgi:hypothetical protein